MSNIVEVLPTVDFEICNQLYKILDEIGFPEDQQFLFYAGTAFYNRMWREKPRQMETFCKICDTINHFQYNMIVISRNYVLSKDVDNKKYGPQLSISVGEYDGNMLTIADEQVSDHNRPVCFDGTIIPYETSSHIRGEKYHLRFYHYGTIHPPP
jgi:hypothetical protein